MPSLNIVLVEPEIPQNTGNIASHLRCRHRRGPAPGGAHGFRLEDKRLRHAGLDYWPYLTLSTYDSPSEFFENQGTSYFSPLKSAHRHTDVAYPDGCYLLFGKESAGLLEKLLFQHPEQCVRIPMLGGFLQPELGKPGHWRL